MSYFYHKLNPIILRELRSRMRGRRAFIVLTIHIALLSLLTAIIYATFYYDYADQTFGYNSNAIATVPIAEFGPRLGQALFLGLILLLLTIFSFVAPAFGAGAIAGERERQTYETLLLTNLRASQVVWGKVGAIFALLILFILVSLPIQSIAFLFGGVAMIEFLISTLALLVTVLALSTIGVYISSLVRTTTIAVSIAYGIVIPLVYGIPFLIFFITDGPLERYFDDFSSQILEYLYGYIVIFLMSINPFFAAILTGEAAHSGDGYLIYRTSNIGPFRPRGSFWMLSPWLIYVLFYLTTTFLSVRLTIRQVRKIGRV